MQDWQVRSAPGLGLRVMMVAVKGNRSSIESDVYLLALAGEKVSDAGCRRCSVLKVVGVGRLFVYLLVWFVSVWSAKMVRCRLKRYLQTRRAETDGRNEQRRRARGSRSSLTCGSPPIPASTRLTVCFHSHSLPPPRQSTTTTTTTMTTTTLGCSPSR